MRRFLTLVCLLCLAIPAGISISGCYRNPGANYCNGLGYGLKITDIASIDLEPRTTGLSMAFGQTRQMGSPTAKNCKGDAAGALSYTYGTTNNQLVDISPTGNLCAGTWNRNSGGGIGDYTICNKPSPLPATGGLPYSAAYITATASSVVSNPVEVYVHAQVTSLSLVGPQQCLSQGTLWPQPLDVQACYSDNGKSSLMCAPSGVSAANYACPLPAGVSSVPSCTAAIGSLFYSVGTPQVATINTVTNQITADQPGTTEITATVSGSGSSAGYFTTCPPASISVTLNNKSGPDEPVTVTQGVEQNLVTKVTDTNGNNIIGLLLDYQSTNPIDISATSSGSVQANFAGEASVYAICQPASCNPAPINKVGAFGTGLSITSKPVLITTPGTTSSYAWFAAPGQSQYFIPVELLTGTIGSTVRLPYVPNSMVMDKTATSLYFGSAHELMIYNTTSDSISKQDPSVPGVVLAVSPNNSTVLINDQVRRVFYVYGSSGSIQAQFGGMGNAASWTPDGKTLYVSDSASVGAGHSDTLYVYNTNTGWTSYDLSTSGGAANLAITVPGVGAYLSGNPTVAHAWCPAGTTGDYKSMVFYPQSDSVPVQTDTLAASTDGLHILGAAMIGGGVTLSDIGVTIPAGDCPAADANGVLTPLTIQHTVNQAQLSKINATAINQVIPSPAPNLTSNLAFITYTGSTPGAPLPYYVPGTGGGPGTVNYLTLVGGSAVTAPLAGAFTSDNKLFFVSTAGDNKVHYITVSPSAAPIDSHQISPNLPACKPVSSGGNDEGCAFSGSGTVVPATVIVVKPRTTT
jgi:hypothetical protein